MYTVHAYGVHTTCCFVYTTGPTAAGHFSKSAQLNLSGSFKVPVAAVRLKQGLKAVQLAVAKNH